MAGSAFCAITARAPAASTLAADPTLRANATISAPRSRKVAIIRLPTKPEPPVTNTRPNAWSLLAAPIMANPTYTGLDERDRNMIMSFSLAGAPRVMPRLWRVSGWELGDEAAIRARILDETRALVRRHGAANVNVSDVARALGISHTRLYRHFASKSDLIDALGAEAMAEDEALAAALVRTGGPASPRLEALAVRIHLRKCERFRTDAEVHVVYERVARLRPDLVQAYAARMTGALASIIADGIAEGEFRTDLDPAVAAEALGDALAAFVHPVLVAAAGGAPAEARLPSMLGMLTSGFRCNASQLRSASGKRPKRLNDCQWRVADPASPGH